MRIAIVGTGALGGFYGGMLAHSGCDVHFLMRRDYERTQAQGLTVRSVQGDFHLPLVQCYCDPHDIGPVDIAFVAIKATDNDSYEKLVSPLVSDHTLVLTAQNGLGNEETLAQLFGPNRIAGGLAFLCANRLDDGTIEHLDYGYIHIGNFQRGPDEKLHRFAELLNQSGVECKVVEKLALSRWKKLIWNVPFNGLSTLTDLTVDQVVSDSALRTQAVGLMKELQVVAARLGLSIEEKFLDQMMAHTDNMEPYYTSMHLDARAGRALEVEPIFGQPLRIAQEHNVSTPLLSQLYDQLKAKC